ncbi:MAG TPA: DUF1572 family protein [Phycisphaerae bacterium]|nr:DUF1572 family protein [Phycisphaerae bacterium]
MPRQTLQAFEADFQKTKSMIDCSLAQLSDDDLHYQLNPLQNSPAAIVQHLAGNMISRFTDFLTTDGEKPSRNREAEFADRRLPRAQLLAQWEAAWSTLFAALAPLTDADLEKIITIRNEPHTVMKALLRASTHCAWHAAQIALIAKHLHQQDWQYLTIPPGGSGAFNQKMGMPPPR